MSDDVYCSMIHGGLDINLKEGAGIINHCCLRQDKYPIDFANPWRNDKMMHLRSVNRANTWDKGCGNCQSLERVGLESMRQGMNSGLKINGRTDLTGPARLDLLFDISCNLACRTCGTHSSTFWQKHLKEHGEWSGPVVASRDKDRMIELLSALNLENLQQVVFCGGETLLGQSYWDIAKWLTDNVPNAKHQLIIGFQTNGTQPIDKKNYDIIERCYLTKLHVSLDGVGEQFEYLRWPALWHQVQDNLLQLRTELPSNVMFLVEQTISIFNVLYLKQLDNWCTDNFSTNREGDPIDSTKHLAKGIYGLHNCSEKLVRELSETKHHNLIPGNWKENDLSIKLMLAQIKKFDQFRNQSFEKTFPATFAAFKEFW